MADPFSLSGRTALVTGASRDIGAALACALAEAGASIVATARTEADLDRTAETIRAAGGTCRTIACDVTHADSRATLFAAVREPATILVNNAGVEEVAPSTEVTDATWEKIVGTNLKAAFFVAQSFAKALDGRAGSIINLGSLTAAVGIPTAVPYTASKSGVLGMTRALAAEWAPQIRVNALGPGYFRTAMTDAFYETEGWQDAMMAKIPMRRFGTMDDLAGPAVFLASDASAYITGQILYVDGGTLAAL